MEESMLIPPIDAGDFFHMLLFGVKGNENLLLDVSLPGVLGVTLSLGLLLVVGLALAFADTVGLM